MRKRILRTAAVLLLTVLLAVLAILSPLFGSLNRTKGGSGAADKVRQDAKTEEQTDNLETGGTAEMADKTTEENGKTEEQTETAGKSGTASAEDSLEDSAGSAGDVAESSGETLHVTVLGDSIAKGYSGDKSVHVECYGNLAAEQIASQNRSPYIVENYAKNGLDSVDMNEKILTKEEVTVSLENADVIFITVGSNDLLNECKRVVQEILNTDTTFKSADEALKVLEDAVGENPFLVLNIINALANWDYHSFEVQWRQMMDTITPLRKEDAQIIVTDIYNPVANMELPSTMNQVVEDIIGNMNQIMEEHAWEYDYRVASVSESDVCGHVQSDGLHPDQTGQQIIADIVTEEYEEANKGEFIEE